MQLADASQDGVPVLCMTGRLDAVSAPAVEQRLLQAARTGPGLVLDLAGVDYTSSAGLRLLLKAAKEAKAADEKTTRRKAASRSDAQDEAPARPARKRKTA